MSLQRWFANPYPDYKYDAAVHGDLVSELDKKRDALKLQGLQMLDEAFEKGSGVSDGDGGIYVGALGLSYAFLHARHLLSPEEKEKYCALGMTAFNNQTTYYQRNRMKESQTCGLLLGMGGYFVVGSVLGVEDDYKSLTATCVANYVIAAAVCKSVDFLKGGADEFFVGRAGYLAGALYLQQKLGYMPVPKQDLLDIWNIIIESGQKYSELNKSPCPLMYSYHGTEYLGAAHGLCSILQILLSFPVFLNENPKAEALVKSTLDYYMTLQDASGNFPCAMDEVGLGKRRIEAEMLVHWCHGAPGAVYLLAKAYLHYKEKKYLDACIQCGEVVWNRGLLRKGPGVCHGVAGSGYVFLLLNNLLEQRDPKHLYRAMKFAEFLHNPQFQEARRPDSPYSMFEGSAGTACFLLDLSQPDKAEFPFFNLNNNYNG